MKVFRTSMGDFVRILAVSAGALLLSAPGFSQGSAGRILGSITDQSGGVISGATVTVTDVQRGVTRTLTTDQAGEYVAPDLTPGSYTVRAVAQGFKTAERAGLLLEVRQDIRVDLILQPGDQAQTVTVTEEAPLIETTNATLGGTLSNETINELPLNGRNYQNLLVLHPGMMIYPGGGGWTQSTDGIRPEDNQYIVDGLTNDNPLTGLTIINGPGVAGDAATILPIDGIQELNIQENPKAEYGGKPGGVVTVGIKSGTNNIHGTAYAFGRDTAFDARNFFNPAADPKRQVALEQYGATVGGPIKKDKLFYFLGYEAESYSVGNTNLVSVPEDVPQPGVSQAAGGCVFITAGDCTNSLPDAISDLIAGGVQPSALSLKLTGCTPPTSGTVYTCTGNLFPANNGNSPSITQGFPDTFRSDNGVAKIDYHINDQNTVNGMYFQSEGDITAEDVPYLQPQWLSHQINQPRVVGADWAWTPNSRWVNDARFGYVYMQRNNKTVDQSTPASAYGIFTGVTNSITGSLPQIHIPGFTSLGGSPGWPSLQGPAQVYQFVDYVAYVRGNHAIKFGGELRHNGVDVGAYGGSKGAIKFGTGGMALTTGAGSTALEDFLAGFPTTASIQLGSPQRHLTTWNYALSVQDDWRIKPKITLNVGLRYDYITPIRESNDLLGNFDPSVGLLQVGKQISSPYNGDHKDFGPRIGIAWDITGKGTTVVRAGASLIFDTQLPMFVFSNISGNAQNGTTGGLITVPTGAQIVVGGVTTPGTGSIAVSSLTLSGPSLVSSWQNNSSSDTIFPSSSTPIQCGDGLGSDPGPCNVSGMDRNFRNPYVTSWTLGVEHAFTPNLSLDVSYVGNHGSRLPGMVDINQPVPGTTAGPLTAQYPYLGFVDFLSNLYRSNYNGLESTLTERTSHGLSFTLGYTYSHALDEDSYNISPFLPQDSTHPERDYASSDFDLRNRLTLSLTYALPQKQSFAQLLQGWSVNSIVTWQTGEPWEIDDFGDNISGTGEFADRWDFFGNPNDFKSGPAPLPYFTGSTLGAFPQPCQNASNANPGNQMFTLGCYTQGNSALIPPAPNTFGTLGRNVFRDSGLSNVDLSVTKQWRFHERLTAQFRAEIFNIFNHPNFANPYGASSAYGIGSFADPSQPGQFGCGCATPDQAAGNPVLGSGGNRAMQLGLKLLF